MKLVYVKNASKSPLFVKITQIFGDRNYPCFCLSYLHNKSEQKFLTYRVSKILLLFILTL